MGSNAVFFDNKRIAKNTLILYCRTMIIMLITLYTSRVILQVLGVDDYGIYNVVGGIVLLFSFISNTLSTTSQRYLAFDLACNDSQRLRETFSLILLSYCMVALIVLVLSEIFGVWLLNTRMNIPVERFAAANWVLQVTIVSFVFNVFSAPYIAVVMIHEKMNIYAYISIVDVILKLITAYVLSIIPYDKLISYSLLIMVCSIFVTFTYHNYCKRHFYESRFLFYYNRKRFSQITSFAWWNMIGSLAYVLRNQGVNIMLNIFFTPAINAARAISYQVEAAIKLLTTNYFSAVKPQIYKNYGADNDDKMLSLIMLSSRFSFFLLLIFSLPILFNTERILSIWLVAPPEYSTIFVQLVIVCTMIEVFYIPLGAGMQATGKLKNYQIVVNGIYLLNLPLSYIMLLHGYSPESVFLVSIVLALIDMIPRLLFCKYNYGLSICVFLKTVILKSGLVLMLCLLFGFCIMELVDNNSLSGLSLSLFLIFTITIIAIYLFGINTKERLKANRIISRYCKWK